MIAPVPDGYVRQRFEAAQDRMQGEPTVPRPITKPLRCLALALVALAAITGTAPAQDMRILTFGGASLTGNYYAIAKEVCRKVNALGRTDLRCSPEATPGSVYNLHAMRRRELDFALVQSDWQRAAFLGTGPFSGDTPMTELRSIMSLYQEPMTLVAQEGSGILSLADLPGKRLDIGHPATGRRATIQRLVDALDFTEDDIGLAELTDAALGGALCSGAVEAALVVLGHPNPMIASILSTCSIRLLPVSGPIVDAFVAANSEYSPYTIPAGTYPGLSRAVPTFSVSASVLVHADIPDQVVELVLGVLLDTYDDLADAIPALPEGDPLQHRLDGLTAPLHPAALAVFAARGG